MAFLFRRLRQGLAIVLVGLLPGTVYIWGELYLSSYARRPDGSRNIGHMEKLLGGDAVVLLVSFLGFTAIIAGLFSLSIARATGRVTALRLTIIAAVVGALIPLALVIPVAVSSGLSLQLAYPIVAGAIAAFVLSSVFSLVAGLPLDGFSVTREPGCKPSRTDVAVVGVAAPVMIAALIWLSTLHA